MAGLIDAEVETTSFYAADRFNIRAAFSTQAGQVASATQGLVEIVVTLDSQVESLITGYADTVRLDATRGVISIEGRDLTSRFISAQTEESYENKTSSGIVSELATRRGLVPMVTATSTLAGRYYQANHSRTASVQHGRATTEWDVLCWLAQAEDFDIWVSGQSLNFQPASRTAPLLTVTPSTCLSLDMSLSLDLAQGVTVIVKSWNSLSQSVVTQSASTPATGPAPLTRTVLRPNLSASEAQSLANRLLTQISEHERTLHFTMPGDLTMAPRVTINLTGTGSDFDGVYTVCSVDRHISYTGGFMQSVEARSLPWTAS